MAAHRFVEAGTLSVAGYRLSGVFRLSVAVRQLFLLSPDLDFDSSPCLCHDTAILLILLIAAEEAGLDYLELDKGFLPEPII